MKTSVLCLIVIALAGCIAIPRHISVSPQQGFVMENDSGSAISGATVRLIIANDQIGFGNTSREVLKEIETTTHSSGYFTIPGAQHLASQGRSYMGKWTKPYAVLVASGTGYRSEEKRLVESKTNHTFRLKTARD